MVSQKKDSFMRVLQKKKLFFCRLSPVNLPFSDKTVVIAFAPSSIVTICIVITVIFDTVVAADAVVV